MIPSSEASGKNTSTRMRDVTVLSTYAEIVNAMQEVMLKYKSDDVVEILEAGCGSRWSVRLDGMKYKLTGVDLDAEALRMRVDERRDLDEAIVGNLLEVDLGARKFDIIYNSFVLEHVRGAEALLNRFVDWLKPGGIIVLRIPDPNSVQGLITRITPHWFHVLYYRHVVHFANAGKPGYGPYPTLYEPVVSRNGINSFARQRGLVIDAEYGSGGRRHGSGLMDRSIKVFAGVVSLFSLGHYSNRHSDLTYVLRLPK